MSKVEVLLAAYNGAEFIGEQIESILAQSYQDFTILVRDDGSTDGTVDIVKGYISKHPDKIRLVEDSRQGGSAARNFFLLMQSASADYVMFSDQDDVWLSDKIKISIDEMEMVESQIGRDKPVLVFADYEAVDSELNSLGLDESKNQIAAYKTDLRHLLVQNYVTGCLVMANRALYEHAGEYDDRIEMHDWWLTLYAAAFGTISHIPHKVMLYRQHGNNAVGATDVKSFKYRLNKFRDPATASAKDRYYAQAELFAGRYGDSMGTEAAKTVSDFIRTQDGNKLQRVAGLIRGRYFKGDIVRVIGQLWYI